MHQKKKNFLKLPLYPGGAKALKDFVGKEIKYPEAALKQGIEGRVYVSYEVDDTGKVVSSYIEKGLGYGCDEEALRLVNMLQYDSARNLGRRVKSRMRLTINFNLPVSPPLTQNISYNYTSTAPSEQEPNEIATPVYSYTITYQAPHDEENNSK